MKVVVAGGTGFIGRALVEELSGQGQDVVVLTRRPGHAPKRGVRFKEWSVTSAESWQDDVSSADVVINLAGEPIADGRWTTARKRALIDSRVQSTRRIVEALSARPTQQSLLINGSGIGYYGASDDRVLDEQSPLGEGFLAELSATWEEEALRAGASGTRVVLLRTGMVLEQDGGALPKMVLPFRLFAGGPILPGTQWVSWIHRRDLIDLIQWVITTSSLSGPVNAVAPEAVTMKMFCETVGKVLHRPLWLPVPRPALSLALGELGNIMTTGQRVHPSKALAGGYAFRYSTLGPALQAILVKG